jgi:hypothetical protein
VTSENKEQQPALIPDEETLSRAEFELPGAAVAPESYWRFGYDSVRDECAESVYWRRHAESNAEIHQRGVALEQIKRQRSPNIRYVGFRSARAGDVRKIVSDKGHKLIVYHFPQNGDFAHTHIAIEPAAGISPKKIKSRDVLELTTLLLRQFSQLQRP